MGIEKKQCVKAVRVLKQWRGQVQISYRKKVNSDNFSNDMINDRMEILI